MRKLTRGAVFGLLAVALVLGLSWSLRGATPPPAIGDLNNTWWELTVSGPEYDLAGGQVKTSHTITTTLTVLDADRVHFDTVLGGMVNDARYQAGQVLMSYSSAESPSKTGSLMQAAVSGAPGKMKMKGQYTTFVVDEGFEVLRVFKLTAKQIPAP